MFARLDEVLARMEEIQAQLSTPEVACDHKRSMPLTKEAAQLRPLTEAYLAYKKARSDLDGLRELLDDPEMREEAHAESVQIQEQLIELEQRLKVLLLPPDPYEGRSVILEIRAGTGGDEAALFAADLFRMYVRYCESKRWKLEIISASEVVAGGRTTAGYREVVSTVSGDGAYSHLRFESGVHRVQRVPATEAQGRIHTSAATVAVLPEAEPVEVNIQPQDLRIDVFRAGGPGGQSVNTTDSAVRVTHIPSGMVVICQDEKSQHKNKARALQVLAARLLQKQQDEQSAAEAAQRRAMVGTGDRSERIRTYNFPQNRLTDHRINVTLYKLDRVMEGELDEMVTALQAAHQAELLKVQDSST